MLRGRERGFYPWVRGILTLIVLGWVGWKLWSDRDALLSLLGKMQGGDWGLVFLAIILLPLNLGLEVQKWRVLLKPHYPDLGLGKGMGAILSGMAAGFLTPNRVGEYAGRVLFLPEGARLQAVGLTFLDRICQMLVTLVVGLGVLGIFMGLFWEKLVFQIFQGRDSLIWFFIGINVLLGSAIVGLMVYPAYPIRWAKKVPAWSSSPHLAKLEHSLSEVGKSQVRKVLALSFLRYLTFSFQYLLLLIAMGWNGPWLLGLGLVILVFLGKSLFPYFGVGELGVREGVAIAVMGAFGLGAAEAFSSALALYCINILFPTLLGLYFIQKTRIGKGGGWQS